MNCSIVKNPNLWIKHWLLLDTSLLFFLFPMCLFTGLPERKSLLYHFIKYIYSAHDLPQACHAAMVRYSSYAYI